MVLIPGQPVARQQSFDEMVRLADERKMLGLPPMPCGAQITNMNSEDFGTPCKRPATAVNGTRCGLHRYVGFSKKDCDRIADDYRQEMAQYLLPHAFEALQDVLTRETEYDEEGNRISAPASDGDKLRAAGMIMDRVGVTAGSTLKVEAEIAVVPARQQILDALAGIAERLGSHAAEEAADLLGDANGPVVPGIVVESAEAV